MHIPDNFLSTPVWATFDAIGAPAAAIMARSAKRELNDARIPLLGVMGAFIFAAQMINFPVGVGTSGHLVGGALLACVMGVAPAAVVMTAIIATQAIVFQDGGILALGANVFNMAIAGVLAGYLPFKLWGATRWRIPAIFLGGLLSVIVSGSLALSELLISGVPMPGPTVPISFAFFAVNGLLEGAITVVVIQAIEKLNPGWVRRGDPAGGRAMASLAGTALLLGVAGFLFASTNPDGIQRLGLQLGLGGNTGYHAPLADYATPFLNSPWLRKALAGLAGLTIVFGACAMLGKMIARHRSA